MHLSCHENMLGNLPLAEKFRVAREAGFDGLDLRGDLLHAQLDEVKRLVAETGMPVPTIYGRLTTPLVSRKQAERTESMDILRGRLADAAAAGARWLVVVPIFGEARIVVERGGGVEEVEEAVLLVLLHELAADAAAVGVTVVLEPLNRKQTHLLVSPSHTAELTRRLDPWVGTMVDFFHMDEEGQDAAREVAAAYDQLHLVHLSDRERALPGEGAVDFMPGLRALRDCGYDGWYGYECKGPYGTEQLRASVDFVRECIAGIEAETVAR